MKAFKKKKVQQYINSGLSIRQAIQCVNQTIENDKLKEQQRIFRKPYNEHHTKYDGTQVY